MNKVTKAVAEMGRKSAVKQTGWTCVFWLHQPKIPAKLLEMKKTNSSEQK